MQFVFLATLEIGAYTIRQRQRYRREKTSRFSLLAYTCATISLTVVGSVCRCYYCAF